jgi:hypothetical protein
MPINYQLGKIYKIECNVTGLVYVGSTCEPTLARRLANHVGNYKSWLNGAKKYMSSYKVLENDDYDIILLEKYPCENKDELHARERYHTNNMECVNKLKNQGLIAELGGKKEYKKHYKIENKEKIQEQDKLYREKNKEKEKARIKKFHIDNVEYYKEKHNCVCGGHYIISHKLRHERSKRHQEYIKTGL